MTEPFRFANGQLAYTVEDLKKICEQSPQDSLSYLIRGDFENWLTYIGDTKAAQQAREARQANLNETERLQKFLRSPKASPEIKPTQVKATVTKTPEKLQQEENPIAKFLNDLFKMFTG